jgi:PilZ domain
MIVFIRLPLDTSAPCFVAWLSHLLSIVCGLPCHPPIPQKIKSGKFGKFQSGGTGGTPAPISARPNARNLATFKTSCPCFRSKAPVPAGSKSQKVGGLGVIIPRWGRFLTQRLTVSPRLRRFRHIRRLDTGEKRKTPRRRVLKGGRIEFGGGAIECTVRNFSEAGAALDVPSLVGIPEQFSLAIPTGNIRRLCVVIWRKEKRIGVAFYWRGFGLCPGPAPSMTRFA